MSSNGNGWRTQPMYTFSEVANLAGVSVTTVRNWLFGYTVDERKVSPLFQGPREQILSCSFLQLVEILVAARFRKAERTSFPTVRRAYDNARTLYSLDYPFAHLRLKSIGGHIVHMIASAGSLQSIDTPEQYTLPDLVNETIDQLEFELELASKWYPIGKKIPIVVDPRVSAGLPVVSGRGVTVEAIEKRFEAGQKEAFIAKDFELDGAVVEEVIRYARRVLHGERIAVGNSLR
jgi:uncharacterized protein (DUF433 family)